MFVRYQNIIQPNETLQPLCNIFHYTNSTWICPFLVVSKKLPCWDEDTIVNTVTSVLLERTFKSGSAFLYHCCPDVTTQTAHPHAFSKATSVLKGLCSTSNKSWQPAPKIMDDHYELGRWLTSSRVELTELFPTFVIIPIYQCSSKSREMRSRQAICSICHYNTSATHRWHEHTFPTPSKSYGIEHSKCLLRAVPSGSRHKPSSP